jgi:pimeloyl-ACP methyl ester carboxylesterase
MTLVDNAWSRLTETMGALTAIKGRDQAFDAIYAQDFPAVLREVRCPIRVIQAADDMLTFSGMLDQVREERPDIRITFIGPAGMAAPERKPVSSRAGFFLSSQTPRARP